MERHNILGDLEQFKVEIGSLKDDPGNLRIHDQRNIDAIKSSLEKLGQHRAAVVQKSTGYVRVGNGMLQAARELGWTHIAAIVVEEDDEQAIARAIADNSTAELATWNTAALNETVSSLSGFDYEFFGIDAPEVEKEIEDPGPEEPPEKPKTKRGDLWILGDHRLLCGDSTKAEDVARVLDGEKAALLSTDLPYCVDYTGADRPGDSGKDWSHTYRDVDIADLGEFLDAVFTACLPHVAERTGIYIWHAHLQQPVIAATFAKHGLLLHQVLVWVKPVATFGHSYYRWKHEPCAFGWRQGFKPEHGLGQLESVWEVDWEGKARVVGNEHPTQKPLRLFEIPMEQHTKPGDIVLEPFSGSGSQLIAAEKLGRRCRAIEIAPAFVDVAVRRWEKATGRVAVLEPRP